MSLLAARSGDIVSFDPNLSAKARRCSCSEHRGCMSNDFVIELRLEQKRHQCVISSLERRKGSRAVSCLSRMNGEK
jgi:hypothetical protein